MDCFLAVSLVDDEVELDVGDDVDERDELALSIIIMLLADEDSAAGLDDEPDEDEAPEADGFGFELTNSSCERSCLGASVELEMSPLVAGVEWLAGERASCETGTPLDAVYSSCALFSS